MLSITDVVALARAGYTPKDVKELIDASKSAETSQPETQPTPEPQIISQSIEAEPDKPAETSPKESEPPADETDYKALYEAEKQKVNDLQIKNTQADISQHQPTEADLVELVKSFC